MKEYKSISQNPIYETFCIIIGAYLSYALAHLNFFQLSGDVAIFFYGLVMAHYTKYNLSLDSFKSIGLSFNLLMQLSEAVSFIYIGLSFMDAIKGHSENLVFASAILMILLICRILVVSVVAIIKRKQKNFRVHGGEWVAAVSTCLVKGPLAYVFMNVLIPGIPDCIDVHNKEHYEIAYPLFVMQICVVGSLLVFHPLNFLVFKCAVQERLHEGDDIESKVEREREHKERLLEDSWVIDRKRPRVFAYVDEFYLKPLFIRDYFERKGEINKLKLLYDDLAAHYDHGIHLEHEIHEDHHKMCGHGDEHGEHSHGHGHGHKKEHGHGHHDEGHHGHEESDSHSSKSGHHDSSHDENFSYLEDKKNNTDETERSSAIIARKTARTEIIDADLGDDANTSTNKEGDTPKIVFDSMVVSEKENN